MIAAVVLGPLLAAVFAHLGILDFVSTSDQRMFNRLFGGKNMTTLHPKVQMPFEDSLKHHEIRI